MIRLAEIVARYAPELLKAEKLLPSQLAALNAFQNCRSATSPKMQLICDPCAHEVWLPHSCGNRHCPHCRAHESQRWIDQQLQKLVPGNYAMITFTLPAEFRSLAWHHQRELYELITRNAGDTVNTFSRNDKKLRGSAGATTVLHTHSRRLDYHPHVHLLMPAVAFDAESRLWREKDGGYLFCHKALAKVFHAKMLDSIKKAGLTLPARYPADWVVDCKARRHRAKGAGVPWPIFVSRRVARKKHRVKPERVGDVSLPTQRNQKNGNPHFRRRGVSEIATATHPAKRL